MRPATEDAGFDDEARTDKRVLELLLRSRWPIALEAIARELGSYRDAQDSIGRLAQSGLAHHFAPYAMPSRPAERAEELRLGASWGPPPKGSI